MTTLSEHLTCSLLLLFMHELHNKLGILPEQPLVLIAKIGTRTDREDPIILLLAHTAISAEESKESCWPI